MTRDRLRGPRVAALLAAAIAVVALLMNRPAVTAPLQGIALSGYEFFLGISNGDSTERAIFGGWTANSPLLEWAPPLEQNGGLWLTSVSYSGNAGIVEGEYNSVIVTGGFWLIRTEDQTIGGQLLEGQVDWPPFLSGPNSDIGCGEGVASFRATLAFSADIPAGTLTGCLDDMRGLIPPRIWGSLSLDSAGI